MIDEKKIYICPSMDVTSHSLYGIVLYQTQDHIGVKTFSNGGRTEYPERKLEKASFQKYYHEATEEELSFVKDGTKLESFFNQFYEKNEDFEIEF